MSKYKPYPQYKDSGVEWLGNIPNEWNPVKLKYLVSITTGNKDTENKDTEGKYPFFVRSKTIERINTYSYDGEAILTAGDGDIGKIFHYINGKFDFHQRVYMFYKIQKYIG
ncbi:MAG: restriction endonuclease subunit S [Sulfurospirillum sp.]|nr:restriction endonuclease subunit S [Sulfurospirillum sp.]